MYIWIPYMYSYIKHLNEDEQRAFMKALLHCHTDVDEYWYHYKFAFEQIKKELEQIVRQAESCSEDTKQAEAAAAP